MSDFIQMETKLPRGKSDSTAKRAELAKMSPDELAHRVAELEEDMLAAAEQLRFEHAAKLRDEVKELHRELDRVAARAR